jgi:5-methylcytosine-specific restriction protein A
MEPNNHRFLDEKGHRLSKRNPSWTRDELILAPDLYFRHNPARMSETHPSVVELSRLLNKLPIHPQILRT